MHQYKISVHSPVQSIVQSTSPVQSPALQLPLSHPVLCSPLPCATSVLQSVLWPLWKTTNTIIPHTAAWSLPEWPALDCDWQLHHQPGVWDFLIGSWPGEQIGRWVGKLMLARQLQGDAPSKKYFGILMVWVLTYGEFSSALCCGHSASCCHYQCFAAVCWQLAQCSQSMRLPAMGLCNFL